MWIDSYVRERRYGGYPCSDFKIKTFLHQGEVNLSFSDLDGTSVGSLNISRSVAREIAHLLIEAADGCFEDEKVLTVRNDTALTEQSAAFNNLLLMPASIMPVDKKAISALGKAGVARVVDLVMLTDEELLEVKGLKAKDFKEIKSWLKSEHLELGFSF